MSRNGDDSCLRGSIYLGDRWVDGTVYWQGSRITDVRGDEIAPADIRAPYILPGFIDLHVHGGGGCDVMDGGNATATVASTHARHGTTSLLATTMTASHEDILGALRGIHEISVQHPDDAGASILGVHLEGPYINPDKLGAQPDVTRRAVIDEIASYHDTAPLRVVTLAPEMLVDDSIVTWLVERGIRAQAGHSLASYETGCAALKAGISGFTHLFNAMPQLHHRAPGLLGAALAHAKYAELIPDLEHVHPGAIRAALRAIPSLYCVTDGTAASGMPDGEYHLGTQQVHKCCQSVRLPDGGLAGSCLTMDRALRNLVSLGLTLGEASDRVSRLPAEYLGESERGRISQTAYADLVVLNTDLEVRQVMCGGRRIPGET